MNQPTRLLLAAALASSLGAASAQEAAQDTRAARAEKRLAEFDQRFDAADTNRDGKLSREEAAALPRLVKHFDAIDSAKTGFVTKEQVAAMMKKQIAERRSGG